jgi:ATP-dependent Clp protease ATP-binding subunit ClpA
MFERFTERAHRAVVAAQDEAVRLHHNHIGKEHLLLGLLAVGEGVAWEVLEGLGVTHEAAERAVVGIVETGPTPGRLGPEDAEALSSIGIDLEEVRRRIEQSFGPGALDRTPPTCGVLFTPKAKQALELARREAIALRHDYIGTEHVLLGVLRSEGGSGGAVVDALHLDLRVVRRQILDKLGRAS